MFQWGEAESPGPKAHGSIPIEGPGDVMQAACRGGCTK